MSIDFDTLRWYRLRLTLAPARSDSRRVAPHTVFEAVGKAVCESLGWRPPGEDFAPGRPLAFFHALRGAARDAPAAEYIICRAVPADVAQWADALRAYFAEPRHQVSYALRTLDGPEERCLAQVAAEFGPLPEEGELCLHFDVALPFKRQDDKPRTFIQRETFIRCFTARFERLFGGSFAYGGPPDDFRLLPYFWHFSERRRESASQPGKQQWLTGCAGPLYIKGRLADLAPWLLLGAELHAGSRLSNSQGRYRLYPESLPFFSSRFADKAEVCAALNEISRRHDRTFFDACLDKGEVQNIETASAGLYDALKNGQWRPSPSDAFAVRKKNGSERIIERFSLEDMTVCELIKRRLAPAVEKLSEDSSWGYRKGRSRQDVAKAIQAAVQDGFRYAVESDIDDFFPSVDHARLFALLEELFPERDSSVLDLLKMCLRNGYALKGRICERRSGLAQGSPLSPLLANLYLDAFDEDLQRLDARLFRYADDFVLLTRTAEQAKAALEFIGHSLEQIGLALKDEKTHIIDINEGFSFLGMKFTRGEREPEFGAEIHRLKKPLFITEPGIFLGLNGDAVSLVKYRQTIDNIPLRRLSEIVVLETASVSTAVLARCVEMRVPVTLALGSGYNVTTIKPDSKEYYLTVARHGMKYESLSAVDRLAVAQEIARCKILNYIPVFKQRYEKGAGDLLSELQHRAGQIPATSTVEEVRGIEGIAARSVWKALGEQIGEADFAFTGRKRRKPDRLNSLLNFGYYLLFTRLNTLLRSAGLSPYLGFLHAAADDYESLVCDLQELFRSRVDRLILKLINLKVISQKHFEDSERGQYLSHEGTRLFVQHFESELLRKSGKEDLSWLELMQVQVASVKRWALDEGSLQIYRWEK